jgi:P-type Ca2+ transporter type 2C
LVLHWPLILSPVHIVFLELIIDPACSIAFEAEPEEAGIMNRPPRNPHEPLFGRNRILFSLFQGIGVLLTVLLILGLAVHLGQAAAYVRAQTFTTLVAGILGLIFANRSWSQSMISTLGSPNKALWWVVGGAIAFLVSVLYVPYLREVFRFAALPPAELTICLGAGLLSVVWFDIAKVARSKGARTT